VNHEHHEPIDPADDMNPTPLRALCTGLAAALAASVMVHAQEILLQEGFNTDGDMATPRRYTLIGREAFEPDRIINELGLFDQKGPMYWAHNFDVSYVGNPTIPARRAIVTWRGTLTDPSVDTATDDLLELWESTVDWLLEGKAAATIVVHPTLSAIGVLADHLLAAGHTVVDDDTSVGNELDLPGDLFIHGPGASNPSRFVLMPKPVITLNAPDYDDMLVGSIGTAVTFEPGQVTIQSANHPAAGGKTGSFDAFTGSHLFELIGSFLPSNAVTLATVRRVVPPSVANLADVDAMIAGTKMNESVTAQEVAVDFADASAGNWFIDFPVPGGYTGNWGLRIQGTLNVAAAGTYRFALGSDDGARFQIDLDDNGFTVDDNVLEDPGPHAHQIVYANIEFTAAGDYDFQIIAYNSGGGGSLELSVGIFEAAEVLDDNLNSGYWELIGTDGAFSPVTLDGTVDVTAYTATGADVIREEPLIVLLNGPGETPPGAFYDGGPVSGFEGAGYLAGAGLNKWAYPDGLTYRAVQFNPVDVEGRENVRLTVAFAASVVDFEDSDFLDVIIYPNGLASTPVTLAHFRGVQNAVQPWLADANQNFVRRLTRQFADFSYNIPEGATDLVIEIRAATSWWTELLAIDNVRLTAGGAAGEGPVLSTPTLTANDITLSWTGGQSPFVIQRTDAFPATWVSVVTNDASTVTVPLSGTTGFFRVQSGGAAASAP
jgi:hypothetical protein